MGLGTIAREIKMPKGVYVRKMTPAQVAMMRENLAKGRTAEAQAKAGARRREIAEDPNWREKVSEATQKAMHRPEVRKKHLAGLGRAIQAHGANFKGGKSQPPTPLIQSLENLLEPLGFLRELKVLTRGHGTSHNPPNYYHIDFGHAPKRIAIEIDGTSHNSKKARYIDKKKDEVMIALGWLVLRFTNREAESNPSTVLKIVKRAILKRKLTN